MNLSSHLENLRSKPEHVRKHYAFWSALGFTAIIFTFWISSFSPFASGNAPQAAVVAAVDRTGTPAESLTASVGNFFGDLKDMVFGPKKVTFSTVVIKAGK